MPKLLAIFLILVVQQVSLFSQNSYLPLNRDLLLFHQPKQDSIHSFHSSIKPFLSGDLIQDTSQAYNSHKGISSLSILQNNSGFIKILTLLIASMGLGSGHISTKAAGAELSINAGAKFSLVASYLINSENFPSQYAALLDSGFIPHYGKSLSHRK